MTRTPSRPSNERLHDRTRRALCLVTIVACVPYLILKCAWLAGSQVGIPQDSVLLEGKAVLHAVNALTVVMDAAVVVLALALVRPWGRRIPAWLLLGPLWVGTGLLAPILLGAPLSALASLFGADGESGPSDSEPFLDGWVSAVVYGGFSVQGLALGVLFFLYAKDRWGVALGGRLADLRTTDGPAGLAGRRERPPRTLTLLALALTLVPFTLHLLWALGARTALPSDLAKEMDSELRLSEGVHAVFALSALVALVVVACLPWRRVRVGTAAALGWCGGSVMTAWGGWWLLMSATNALGVDQPSAQDVGGAHALAYAAQVIAGLLVLTLSVLFARQHLAVRLTAQPVLSEARETGHTHHAEGAQGQSGHPSAREELVERP